MAELLSGKMQVDLGTSFSCLFYFVHLTILLYKQAKMNMVLFSFDLSLMMMRNSQ